MDNDKEDYIEKIKKIEEKFTEGFEGINTTIYERQDDFTDVWIEYFTKNNFLKFARAFYIEQFDEDELVEVREKTFSIISYDMLNVEQIKQALVALLYLGDYKKAVDLLFTLIRIQKSAKNYRFEEKEDINNVLYRQNLESIEIEPKNIIKKNKELKVASDFRAINWIFQKYEENMTELNKIFHFKMNYRIDILREFDDEETIKYKQEMMNNTIEILEKLKQEHPEEYKNEYRINKALDYFIGKKTVPYRFFKDHIEAVLEILPNNSKEYDIFTELLKKLEIGMEKEYEIAKEILYKENIITDINTVTEQEKTRIKQELLLELEQIKKQIKKIVTLENKEFFNLIDTILNGNLNINYYKLKITTDEIFKKCNGSEEVRLKEQLNFTINKIKLLMAKERIDDETFTFFYKKILTKKYSKVYYMSKFDRQYLIQTFEYMISIVLDVDSRYVCILKLINEILNPRDGEIKESQQEQREKLYKFIRIIVIRKLKSITEEIVEKNKDLITTILEKLINKERYFFAFELLFQMGVKNYFYYLPKDKKPSFYLQKLKENETATNDSLIGYDIKETLYAPKIQKENPNANEMELKILYFKYLEQNNAKTNILVKYYLYNIVKFLEDDLDLFQKYPYFEEKANEISKLSRKDINSHKLRLEIMNFFVGLIEKKETFKEKRDLIDRFSNINIFKYNSKERRCWTVNDDNWNYFEISQKVERIYEQSISQVTQDNIEDYIYIYMNSTFKEIIPIERVVQDLTNKKIKNIIYELNKYKLYARVFKKGFKSYKLKITNARNDIYSNINLDIVHLPRNVMEGEIVGIKLRDNRFKKLVYDITEIDEDLDYNQYYDIIDDYFKKYEDQKNVYIQEKSVESIFFLEKNVRYYIYKQLELIKKIDKNIISKLQKDISGNFYNYDKYMKTLTNNKDNRNDILFIKKQLATVRQMTETSKLTKKFSKEYYEEARNIIIKMLKNNNLKTTEIVDVYMNTCLKYLVSLSKFIRIMLDIRGKNEKINVQKKFSDYLFLSTSNTSYQYFYIKDFNNNKLVTKNIKMPSIPKTSSQLIKVNKLLHEYLSDLEEMNIQEISNMEKVPEFESKDRVNYAFRNLVIDSYIELYEQIVINNIQDEHKIKQLKQFLEALGENNLWKDNDNSYDYSYIKMFFPTEEIKQEIIKRFCIVARSADLDDIFYVYKNTCLRKIISIDQLLRNAITYNSKNVEKLKNDIFDLKKYELKIGESIITKYNFNTEEIIFE